MVIDLLGGHLAAGGHEFVVMPNFEGGAVILAPGGAHEGDVSVSELQAWLDVMPWAVVLLTADEAGLFPWRELEHPNMRLWLQTPHPERHLGHDRFLIVGYPPATPRMITTLPLLDRSMPWIFMGQINHERRVRMAKRLRTRSDGGHLFETEGFTQGVDRADYLAELIQAKIALCPSGPATPDTFRFAEALEAGCLPIVDQFCPAYEGEYWPMALGKTPLPYISNWGKVNDFVDHYLLDWPVTANRVSAWWQGYKRQLHWRINDDVAEVSGQAVPRETLTVLIPTSPIPSHPDTSIIEETVASVRHWHSTAEIIVMCDGVRPEQEHHRANYEEYLNRLMWLCEHRWENTLPLIFDDHTHQAGMTRAALELIQTDLLLFVEHDTPLVIDRDIDWPAIYETVLSGELNVVRLHHEHEILHESRRLMVDHSPQTGRGGLRYQRTIQWSQRPHVADVGYYRRLLTHEKLQGLTMIEDRAHSLVQTEPWGAHRVAVYTPPGDNIKRSWHTDGRAGDEKWAD